jgi:hypothetical protein
MIPVRALTGKNGSFVTDDEVRAAPAQSVQGRAAATLDPRGAALAPDAQVIGADKKVAPVVSGVDQNCSRFGGTPREPSEGDVERVRWAIFDEIERWGVQSEREDHIFRTDDHGIEKIVATVPSGDGEMHIADK